MKEKDNTCNMALEKGLIPQTSQAALTPPIPDLETSPPPRDLKALLFNIFKLCKLL